jgi:hypothetical protein
MCFIGVAQNDALAKARGEPTQGFHNIQPNYSNPEIMAAVADKKAGRSTKFYDTGVPNVWQQYADQQVKQPKKSTPVGAIEETRRRTPATVSKTTVSKKKGDAVGRGLMTGVNTGTSLLR